MNKRLLLLKFPEGASTLFVNGKTYTREEFHKAQQLVFDPFIVSLIKSCGEVTGDGLFAVNLPP